MKPARESDMPSSSSSPPSGTTRAPLADMRLADAITVLAVERLGSMSKAARELGVTPSQVSKTISRLQSWTGGSLFAREGTELKPTPLGKRFLERMRPLVEALRDLAGDVEMQDAVRVQACELAFLLTVSALTEVTGGRFVVSPATSEPASDADLMLRLGEAPSSWSRSVTLSSVAWGLFAAPATAARLGVIAAETELSVTLVPVSDPEADAAYGDVLRALIPCPYRFGTRVPVHSALEVVAASDQIVAFPIGLALRYLASGRLVEITPGGNRPETPLVACATGDQWEPLVQEVVVRIARG